MNSNRTYRIEILLGLLGTATIAFALGLYILGERGRLIDAQEEILHMQLDESMTLFAENCAVCHGLSGEGLGATPPLDSPGLQSVPYDELFKVIARGRFETAMPAWSKEDGGSLSDYQIGELVALVQNGDWEETGDRVVNLGLAPLIPFATEPDADLMTALALLPDGPSLQIAVSLYAEHCVACHGADGLGSGIAPALNDPEVRLGSAEELSRTISYGTAGTLMAGWGGVLAAGEIEAMVGLIQRWDELPAGLLPAPDVPVPTTVESLALGAELYSANCSRCHGPEGQGKPIAPSLNVKSLLTGTSDQAMQQIITLGVPGTAMPAWGDRMSAAEIQAIVGFIRQWEATAPEVAQPLGPPSGGGGPPWLRNQGTQNQAADGVPASPLAPSGQAAAMEASGTGAEAQPAPTHQPGAGAGQGARGAGPGDGAAQEAATQALDWHALALITVALSLAFSLIATGISALRRAQGRRPPT